MEQPGYLLAKLSRPPVLSVGLGSEKNPVLKLQPMQGRAPRQRCNARKLRGEEVGMFLMKNLVITILNQDGNVENR